MKRGWSIASIAALLLAASPSVLLAEDATMHDRGLDQWFVFAGLRTKIDSIQSVAQADGNKILGDVNTQDPSKGYLILTIEYQNLYTRYGALLSGVIGAYLMVFHRERVGRFFARTRLVNALAVAIPMRSPVNVPGPTPTAIRSASFHEIEAASSTAETSGIRRVV